MPDLDFGAQKVIEFEDEPALPAELSLAVPPDHRAQRAAPQAPPRAPAPSPQATRPPAKAPQVDISHGRGAEFDADDDAFGGGNVSLELDVKPGTRATAGGVAPSGPPRAVAGHGVVAATAQAPSFKPLPPGVAERYSPEIPVETFEARVLGNFGEAPKHFWQAPLYAWRVRQRLQELRRALAERTKAAERANEALEQSLVALGQRARSTAEKNPSYGRALDGLRLHEQTLRQRDGALMTEMDGHNRKLAVIDQKIGELHNQLVAAQAEERRLADELAMGQATIQRAEAKLKRLDIELRSVFGPNDPRRGGP